MKKSKKPKKIRSIKHQITFTFIGLLFLSILTISMINGAFLEKYYVSKKTETLLEAREVLSQINTDSMTEDDVESEQEELSSEIIQESSRNNLTWVVVNEDNTKYLCWPENEDQLRSKLFFGYASDLDMDNGKGTILKQTDNCVVQQVYDRFVGMDYVECWGKFDNGNYFLIRSPLESIQESANISNKFYFFVGIVIIVISGMCIMAVTRKLTRPISELTELSRKMTDLDFEARYKSKAGNEIDVLGDNFNKMSSQLEHTISELKSANNELQKDIENKVKIDEMRKEFLDNVSHELKTPIALVQGYAEGLKENINDDPESMDFYCDVIIDEAAKMNKLVKNLLTLNQLESGKDAAVMERFDLTALIKGVLSTMDIMIRQKEARVIFNETEPLYVWADEFKTEEVVTNQINQELVDAFEKGQVSLLDPVPQALLDVDNPYDWTQRTTMGESYKWDHLLYNGKYYSYYGITTVLTLFMPYHKITGKYFSTALATYIYSMIALIFIALIYISVVKNWFKKIPFRMTIMGLFTT